MCLSILIFLLNVLSSVEFQISQPDATETNENFRSHENWLQESDATDCHFMQGGHLSGLKDVLEIYIGPPFPICFSF